MTYGSADEIMASMLLSFQSSASTTTNNNTASTLRIALDDASHALLEAVEKESGVGPPSTVGMKPEQPSAVGVADDTLEDPMIAAFLQAQERCAAPPSLDDFKDWARLVVAIKSRSKQQQQQQQQQPHCDEDTDRKGVPPMSTCPKR